MATSLKQRYLLWRYPVAKLEGADNARIEKVLDAMHRAYCLARYLDMVRESDDLHDDVKLRIAGISAEKYVSLYRYATLLKECGKTIQHAKKAASIFRRLGHDHAAAESYKAVIKLGGGRLYKLKLLHCLSESWPPAFTPHDKASELLNLCKELGLQKRAPELLLRTNSMYTRHDPHDVEKAYRMAGDFVGLAKYWLGGGKWSTSKSDYLEAASAYLQAGDRHAAALTYCNVHNGGFVLARSVLDDTLPEDRSVLVRCYIHCFGAKGLNLDPVCDQVLALVDKKEVGK